MDSGTARKILDDCLRRQSSRIFLAVPLSITHVLLDRTLGPTVLYSRIGKPVNPFPTQGGAAMNENPFADASFFTHTHLPIAAAYCRILDVRGVVDRMVPAFDTVEIPKMIIGNSLV